jgi:hypothetical protein
MKTWYLAAFLLITLNSRAALEFSGYFITAEHALYSLTDTESRRTSGWLKIGQTFADHTIVSFDREHEVIHLRKGETPVRLPLREAKVKDARATITGSLTFLGQSVEGVRTTLFFGETSSLPLKDGVTFVIKPEPRPDGTILFEAKFLRTGKDGREETLAAPSVTALAGQPFGIQFGDFGFSFKP